MKSKCEYISRAGADNVFLDSEYTYYTLARVSPVNQIDTNLQNTISKLEHLTLDRVVLDIHTTTIPYVCMC